ncbi:PAS domain S-box-containing protein [Streptomyces sp. WMMB 714]|nr:PAS domain S-box-containing protein [Streptomyces sp. WMMB 714]
MTRPDIDYAALFAATPSPYLVLRPDLVIVDVNRAYLRATGRTREDLLGRYIFDAFPANPADPESNGVENLHASLRRVLESGRADTMALQKYDIPVVSRPGAPSRSAGGRPSTRPYAAGTATSRGSSTASRT